MSFLEKLGFGKKKPEVSAEETQEAQPVAMNSETVENEHQVGEEEVPPTE